MFIRRKPRQSKAGTTFDFYLVESYRSGKGPKHHVLGYIGCIRQDLLNDPQERRLFWESSTVLGGHKGAEERLREIASFQPPRAIEDLIRLTERYVPKPSKP
jgi:hypothetical protein